MHISVLHCISNSFPFEREEAFGSSKLLNDKVLYLALDKGRLQPPADSNAATEDERHPLLAAQIQQGSLSTKQPLLAFCIRKKKKRLSYGHLSHQWSHCAEVCVQKLISSSVFNSQNMCNDRVGSSIAVCLKQILLWKYHEDMRPYSRCLLACIAACGKELEKYVHWLSHKSNFPSNLTKVSDCITVNIKRKDKKTILPEMTTLKLQTSDGFQLYAG